MAIGGKGTYLTDLNIPNYLGDAIRGNEEMAFKYREEKRLKEEKEREENRLREEKQQEEFKKEKVDNKEFDYSLTGQKSLDDIGLNYAQTTFNKFNENVKKINDPSTSRAERDSLKLQNLKLEQSFNVLNQTSEIFKAKSQYLVDGVREGKFNEDDVDLIQRKIGQLEDGKGRVYTDEYGNMLYDIFETDKEGTITKYLEKSRPIASLIKSITPHAASKFDSLLESFKKTTAVPENAWSTGADEYDQKIINESILSRVDDFAKMIVSDPGERYAISKILGVDESNTDAIKKYAYDAAKGSLEQFRKHTVNPKLLDKSSSGSGDTEKLYSIKNLYHSGDYKVGDKAVGHIFQGDVNIERKTSGGNVQKFRSFSIDKDGTIQVNVDVEKIIKDKDGINRSKIIVKKYRSDKNNDIVTYFAQRITNPEGQKIKNVKELRQLLIAKKGISDLDKQESTKKRVYKGVDKNGLPIYVEE